MIIVSSSISSPTLYPVDRHLIYNEASTELSKVASVWMVVDLTKGDDEVERLVPGS